MRQPAGALVVDASILVASVLGRTSALLVHAAERRRLVVTDRAIQESLRRIELGLKVPALIPVLNEVVTSMNVMPSSEFEGQIALARITLANAVASRNGLTSDAHILACAWVTNADIWSYDRDFAGTGVASWSTVNLMRALEHSR